MQVDRTVPLNEFAEVPEAVREAATAYEARSLPSLLITPSKLVTVIALPGGRGVRVEADDDLLVSVRGAYQSALDGARDDLSRRAEDAGVASRATVSNKKRPLEEADLITTEGVKDGIGRPKHRLELTDELQNLDPTDVVRTAKAVLAK